VDSVRYDRRAVTVTPLIKRSGGGRERLAGRCRLLPQRRRREVYHAIVGGEWLTLKPDAGWKAEKCRRVTRACLGGSVQIR